MASTELLVFAFQEEASAGVALAELRQWKKDSIIDIVDAAVLARDEPGNIHVKETADPEPGKGALIGAVAGALVGLLAGPAGVVVGAATGAGVGGFAAHKIDLGIPNERLEEIAQELQPGTSAIIALIERTSADQAVARLEQYGAKAVRQTLTQEIAGDLRTQTAAPECDDGAAERP
jgi:uncharacterized membrane protein